MPPDVTIRSAKPTDASGIYQVMRQSRRDAFGGLLPEAALDWDCDVPEAFREFVEATADHDEKIMFVAVRSDAIVGVAEVVWQRGATAAFVGETAAELKSIHVQPDSRSDGIGSKLLDEAVGTLPSDVTGLSLCVLAENEQARSFYERRGFEQAGTTTTTHAGDDFAEVVYYRPL